MILSVTRKNTAEGQDTLKLRLKEHKRTLLTNRAVVVYRIQNSREPLTAKESAHEVVTLFRQQLHTEIL